MKHFTSLTQIIVTLLIIGCNNRTEIKVVNAKMSEVKDSINKPPAPPPLLNLKVTAHLVYNDGSISSFDVLNDKSIVLWNTISGGGDALKPSTKVKLVLVGDVDDIIVRVKNGKRKVIDGPISHFVGEIYRIIKNTGCEEISVNISRHKIDLYNGIIPFHCGE